MKTESGSGHNRFSVSGRLLIEGRLAPGAIVIDGDRIAEVRLGDARAVGALPEPRLQAALVSPGLVDAQCNGAFGLEVGGDADALRALAARLPETGVTTFLPTIVSAAATDYRAAARALAAAAGAPGARMPGLHLEGPLLAPARAGAHTRAPIADAAATLDDVLPELLAAGAVRLMTIAPERPGALAWIARLAAAGVTVAIGHTDATYDETIAGIDAGATLVTHLYNAMAPFHHRAPGPIGAALTDGRVAVTVIADGVHAHPAALRLALAAKGPSRVALVTDAVAAAGAPAGDYALAGARLVSDGRAARLPAGTLAGSTLTMDRAVRAMANDCGVSVADALTMASTTPAARLGLGDRGRLATGQLADVVLWSNELKIEAAIVGGSRSRDGVRPWIEARPRPLTKRSAWKRS